MRSYAVKSRFYFFQYGPPCYADLRETHSRLALTPLRKVMVKWERSGLGLYSLYELTKSGNVTLRIT